MKILKLLVSLLLILTALSAYSLNIDKACDELKEQQEALLSKLSTSLTEANMAGQCIGYSAMVNNTTINLNTACTELIEQKNNLLGSFSTSLKEANQAGICMGAIYSACGTVNFSDAAQRVIYKIPSSTYKRRLRDVIGCYD